MMKQDRFCKNVILWSPGGCPEDCRIFHGWRGRSKDGGVPPLLPGLCRHYSSSIGTSISIYEGKHCVGGMLGRLREVPVLLTSEGNVQGLWELWLKPSIGSVPTPITFTNRDDIHKYVIKAISLLIKQYPLQFITGKL